MAPDEVDGLLDILAEKLLAVRCGDEPVVQRVVRGADIYSGPQAAHGPDAIALTHYGYDAKGVFGADEVFADTDLQGMHTFDDAFLWTTAPAAAQPQITELRSLIEGVLGG